MSPQAQSAKRTCRPSHATPFPLVRLDAYISGKGITYNMNTWRLGSCCAWRSLCACWACHPHVCVGHSCGDPYHHMVLCPCQKSSPCHHMHLCLRPWFSLCHHMELYQHPWPRGDQLLTYCHAAGHHRLQLPPGPCPFRHAGWTDEHGPQIRFCFCSHPCWCSHHVLADCCACDLL